MRPFLTTIALAVSAFACLHPVVADTGHLTRADLLEDTRELMRTLESVHPDPYLRAGGKIALHRLFQEILESIPPEGMSRADYTQLVQPLLAAVGDGHTFVWEERTSDPYSPGGIPLYFEVAPDSLYVLAVTAEQHRDLLGARLVSVEGVAIDELLSRLRRIRAADNVLHLRRNMAGQGVLWYGDRLRRILPEWQRADRVTVELAPVAGDARRVELTIPEAIDYGGLIMPPPSDLALLIELMTEMQRADIFFQFLDPERSTCLLVIRSLERYREAFEVWHSYGIVAREAEARALFERANGRPAPESYREVLAGLPSATEIFSAMSHEMRRAGTKNLLIDLSQNGGGSSVISSILVRALYGSEVAIAARRGSTEIRKYSPEYFAQFPSPTLDEINAGRPVTLTAHDYDLRGETDQPAEELRNLIHRMPTFAAAWNADSADRPYTPEHVIVLCDAGTYSAAFTLMVHLKRAGAVTVGIPSAQAGNCFGDLMHFELPRSGVHYQVSRKYFELFPGDAERGRVTMPDHVLTYETMASYGFDPLALLRFATDLLTQRAVRDGL